MAAKSDFFKNVFTKNLRDPLPKTLEMRFEDPRNVLEMVIKYLYSCEIEVSVDNIIPIISVSEQLGMCTNLRYKKEKI